MRLLILENVEHCGGGSEQADIMSLMSDVIATSSLVNHSPTCTSIYHSQGALKVFLLAGLLL